MTASDYERGGDGRAEDFGADDRSWMDLCADDECAGRRHAGRGPKDWSRSDQALYVEVCERLMRDRLIDARGLEVEVEDGVVTLSGRAAAPADPALIERLVRETPGVKGVELHIVLGGRRAAPEPPEPEDDAVDKSSLAAPILARRAARPGSPGAA
ncbi:MAG: BON domain-containing protein [Phenylobacterium sp.]|nr:MAG: BON domain-containing protein [Phenylobacterium sp.]